MGMATPSKRRQFVGYANLPAVCPTHGLFAGPAIALGPGATLHMQHSVAICPVCKAQSPIMSGTYQGTVNGIEFLRDPSIPLPALGAIRRLAERAQGGEISPAEAKREAKKIHPKAEKLFDISNWSDQAKATLYASIIGAVAVVAAARIASGPTTIVQPTTFIERVVPKDTKPILS